MRFFLLIGLAIALFDVVPMGYILAKYPELRPFFEDAANRELWESVAIEVVDAPHAQAVAACEVTASLSGMERRLLFNKRYIYPHYFSAEEFNYIFAHELGHLHDERLAVKFVAPYACYGLASAALLMPALKRNWSGMRYRLRSAGLLCGAGYALGIYASRQAEYFADRFAVGITKNLDAVRSALEKRKKLGLRSTFCGGLLDDHPHEDSRIAYLESVYEQGFE